MNTYKRQNKIGRIDESKVNDENAYNFEKAQC